MGPADGTGVAWAKLRCAPLVVMLDVASQDANKLLEADDQQPVQAPGADRPDPALGDGVGVGRLHRCADDLGPGRAPHIVERPVNLASRSWIRNLAVDRLGARQGQRLLWSRRYRHLVPSRAIHARASWIPQVDPTGGAVVFRVLR